MSNTPSSSKNHSKKSKDSGRDRDKNKSVASESGGSSQCDTPPLADKDGAGTSQGKFAGVGPESILCMAEQSNVEMTPEAATNLAEDVSYKLRLMISTIALQSELMNKTRVDTSDVNTALIRADTSPAFCSPSSVYTQVGEEKIYTDVEEPVDLFEAALTQQVYMFSSHPTITAEWITEEKNLNHGSVYSSNISAQLQNYYTKVARAILNLRKKPKELAVKDLMTNTRIGPIFPNLFNLAVLVLNDDNLNALNVPAKKPLQCNVLDMVDALCANPCCLDTNIQQQFQRLFPVMVSNILGNGSMSEKMVSILTKITRTWPSFITIGKSILFEYLSHNTKDRLTGPMVRCVMALGRQALFECLNNEDNLEHLDDNLMSGKWTLPKADLRGTMLDVSTIILRAEPTTFLEEYVSCDYVMCEMLGDSIDPRRTLFHKANPKTDDAEKASEDDSTFTHRSYLRRPKIRIIPTPPKIRNGVHKESVFEPTKFSTDRSVRLKIRNFRSLHVPNRYQAPITHTSHSNQVVIASGLLHRFIYKLNKPNPPPYLVAVLL